MITASKLYEATNCGLDILAIHYKDAAKYAADNIPFKAREGERTPSARLKLFETSQGKVWKLVDFGADAKAISPIDIHAKALGINFREAVLDLSVRFNISDEVNHTVNRPDIRKQPATAEQEDGKTYWDIDQDFTESECEIMGPGVTRDHLISLHWYRVKYLVSVKNRTATYKYSNEHYPIFMRECWFTDNSGKRDRFYKIYEPLNADKGWRFQYQPKGKKPKSYINGLEELRKAWVEMNEDEERLFFKDPENEGKPYKEQKLDQAIICSGERDAACVKSLGCHPIWFNSETYEVSDDEMRQVRKYAQKIYNIPDIDTTGRLKGTQLALRFIDINTVWLPEKLSEYRDHRGHPRKDFRDWVEIWQDKKDFKGLLKLATPAKFWIETRKKETGEIRYSIDISCLRTFLKLNGFYTLKDEHVAESPFIHIQGHIVRKVSSREIRAYVHQWAERTYQPRELRNLILTTPTLAENSLGDVLREVELDFTNYTEDSQYFYFPKFSIEVTGDEIIKHDGSNSNADRYVWDENIIKHNINIFEGPMFEITHIDGCYDSEDFDIKINPHGSNYFRYLINSSRIHWRKELETYCQGLSLDEADAYRKNHKFDIAGPALSPDEIQEQKQCLISKIFTIGYILHRYKSESRTWAPFVMDNVIGENDQCNGRSGKSFMFRALSNFVKWHKMSGRNPRLLDNQFAFEQVTKHHAFVVVDDCDEYPPFKQFYDNITSDITINAKNISAYNLKFKETPKFVFTTNYVPKEFDASSVGRMLFVVFADYYHQQTDDNDYKETRPIFGDFGKDLFGDSYTESEWEADINFILQCVRFYLSVSKLPIKIEPKMDNIIYRKYLRDMSDTFRDWAENYFAVDANGYGEHVNCEVIRQDAFDDYKRFTGATKTTSQRFMKMLRGFVYTSESLAELDPEDMHNSGNRILRDIENPVTHKKEKKQVLYLRTMAEVERLKNPPPPPPTQSQLPF